MVHWKNFAEGRDVCDICADDVSVQSCDVTSLVVTLHVFITPPVMSNTYLISLCDVTSFCDVTSRH